MDERSASEPEPYIEMTSHVRARHGIPDDAARMGLDRNTEEGALVAMAGSLNPAKLSHRIVAWLVLVSFIGPMLFGAVHRIF
ncbi:MAG TPA: hypothetical protein VH419_16795 [Nocardioidaceae bacterium]|jgi:hypothetical protein